MKGRRSALLISTSTYEDPAFRQLQSPVADVAGLRDILEDPEIGNYEASLLSDKAAHEVNRSIERFFTSARVDDLVLLYFSGHGYRDAAGQLFMIMRDSLMENSGAPSLLETTAVSAQFVRNQLQRCRSRRKVVILDCCHAGAFPAGATKNGGDVDVLAEFAGRGSIVLTASSAIQYALAKGGKEAFTEMAGKVTPSVFTGALIEGIKTGDADINGDGKIDFDELYAYTYSRVTRNYPHQTPQKQSDVQGTLFIANSPCGPRPTPLLPEISDALNHPLSTVRIAGIKTLVEYCSQAHAGKILAARVALKDLTDDDSKMVERAARAAIDDLDKLTGKNPVEPRSLVIRSFAWQEEAQREADKIITAAVADTDKLTSTSEREVTEKRAVVERDLAKLVTTTERDVAQMKASAKRERDEILTTAKKQADEMRSQAQRILDQSEAQRAQDEAEFETHLAARREEAERQLADAQKAKRILVAEAERRAANAEERATKASVQADQTRRDADAHAANLVANAKKNAAQIIAQARAQADELARTQIKESAERAITRDIEDWWTELSRESGVLDNRFHSELSD